MYDNIKLSIDVAFDETRRDEFCTRFGLCTKNEKLKIWHNKDEKNLKQNLGVYMHLKNTKLTLEFSLHKVYNYKLFDKQFNYNDFDFKQARKAAGWLDEMFNQYFDIMQAVVKKYEVGINVLTSENPIEYLQELKQINVGTRILRIEEDIRYKEYQQYSTHRDKDKRVIYIFYNKTFEVQSKSKKIDRANVPENILRLEKDNKRLFEKILFSRLFDTDFKKHTIKEYKQRFYNDLVYRETQVKPKDMRQSDFDICKNIIENGLQAVREQYKKDYKEGRTIERTYYRRLQKIERLSKQTDEIKTEISRRAAELNNLIISKLKELTKMTVFYNSMVKTKNEEIGTNENE
ncbi:MAG: hypothetical protein LBH30_03140 [Prevotellaceae bacterium]|jgi:hypothetical protein|nr:hypothetical protein [Prevotellaceae bacterium]